MSNEMKVSYHNETAGDTAAHNDRSMYDYAYTERDANLHWDCYGIGFVSDTNPNGSKSPSVDAEERFYEEHFGGILERTNEIYASQGHAEKRMSMSEYKKNHPPKESIIQLGDKDDSIGDEYLRVAVAKYVEMLTDAGCYVISWDIHNDETDGTPHAHIRWIGIDSQGKPNLAGCLREHGIQKAQIVWTEEEAIQHNKRARKRVKAGDLKGPQINNELTTFTDKAREMLEDLAEPYVAQHAAKLSRERIPDAHHLTVSQFKSKKRREEAEQSLNDREARVEIQAAALDAEREQMLVAIAVQREELERQEQAAKEAVDEYVTSKMQIEKKALQNEYQGRLNDVYSAYDALKKTRTNEGVTIRDVVKKTLELLPAVILNLRFRNPQTRAHLQSTLNEIWTRYVIPLIDSLTNSITQKITDSRNRELAQVRQLLEENKMLDEKSARPIDVYLNEKNTSEQPEDVFTL